MFVIVGALVTSIPPLPRRKILPNKDPTLQFWDPVNPTVNYGNNDSLAGADLPDFICFHGIEMPLLLPYDLRMRQVGRDSSQKKANQGSGRLTHTHPMHCPIHSIDHRRHNTTTALPGLFVFSQVVRTSIALPATPPTRCRRSRSAKAHRTSTRPTAHEP